MSVKGVGAGVGFLAVKVTCLWDCHSASATLELAWHTHNMLLCGQSGEES